MECNKEEAFKAKDVAEKKMQRKDFTGARRLLLKAQQLFPDTENISQMLSVCEVHCSSESKMVGNEKDWYGILQVDQAANDILIKKQYRTLALRLHPDKNKFAGAEAAFKLVGEAQRVLLDREKRSLYDIKRKTFYKPVFPHNPPQQTSRNVGVARQSRAHNYVSTNPNLQRQQANSKETFWTSCLHCKGQFQYYKEFMGRAIVCKHCNKPYITYDMHVRGSASTQPVFPQQDTKPNSGYGFQAGYNPEFSMPQKGKQPQKVPNKVARQEQRSKRRKANRRRGKKHEESSESSESDCSLDSEEVEIHEADDDVTSSQHFDTDGDCKTRRSNRNKRHVSYKENGSDDEQEVTPSKKAKGNASTEEKADESNIFGSVSGEESKKSEFTMDDGTETLARSTKKSFEDDDWYDSSEESPNSTPGPAYHDCPDPEFSDFDKIREEQCFKAGQLWAVYDTVDAMPRFYAKIKRVFNTGFKVQLTWLEPDPDDEVGRKWNNSKLPFPCGKFTFGTTENTEDLLMFSHMVSGCKNIGRNSFAIYPIKGETWGLFKNWDAMWCLVPENERKFEYEFVEILSDYDEIVGIRVALLGKLKGFACLFIRKSVDEIQIRPAEIFRLSHMVPSQRMTGNERIEVPKGSFELDPASITMNLEEINLPQLERKNCVNDLSSKFSGENPSVNVS